MMEFLRHERCGADRQIALSVAQGNPAKGNYVRWGFKQVEGEASSYTTKHSPPSNCRKGTKDFEIGWGRMCHGEETVLETDSEIWSPPEVIPPAVQMVPARGRRGESPPVQALIRV